MSYKALVERQVATAFRLIKDIGSDITFINTNLGSYDFSTGEVSVTSSPSLSIRCLVMNKDEDGLNVILNAKDIPQPDLYDTVELAGNSYSFSYSFESNGFITKLKLFELGG